MRNEDSYILVSLRVLLLPHSNVGYLTSLYLISQLLTPLVEKIRR